MTNFLDTGGLLEELGWRGYALPLLLRKMNSPLTAAVFLGVFWALWHLPREVAPLLMGADVSEFLMSQLLFMAKSVGMTVVIVFFVNITGGSVLPAIMIHGVSNYIAETLRATPDSASLDVLWLIQMLVGVLLVVRYGANLGYRGQEHRQA
nr:CPBP family intramembrane glutamic endopeptidase [Pseudomaricurvus alkylphenolicus]